MIYFKFPEKTDTDTDELALNIACEYIRGEAIALINMIKQSRDGLEEKEPFTIILLMGDGPLVKPLMKRWTGACVQILRAAKPSKWKRRQTVTCFYAHVATISSREAIVSRSSSSIE
jgi:hypothetical protein